jgi:Flp pilus assembly protein TadD
MLEPSKPTPVPAQAPRTPSRGLPTEPLARARVLGEQGRVDMGKGQWASAEANFRLALTYAPTDLQLAVDLKAAVEARDKARRGPPKAR